MWEVIAAFLEKTIWTWQQSRKEHEVENVQNDIAAKSDDTAERMLRDWTKR